MEFSSRTLPNCEHADALATASYPQISENGVDFEVTKICYDCFADHADEVNERTSRTIPLSESEKCYECKASPARYNPMILLAFCDSCRIGQTKRFGSFLKYEPDVIEIPDEILEGQLYLCGQYSAYNKKVVQDLDIQAILVCGNGLKLAFIEDPELHSVIHYHHLPIDDSNEQAIIPYLPHMMDFISANLQANRKVLVHCAAGVSRSASMVIAYVMMSQKITYDEASLFVKARRKCIHPNSRFASELKTVWEPWCVEEAAVAAVSEKETAV